MNGNFNGVQLRRIASLKTDEDAPGFTRTAFRALGGANRKLEDMLHLGESALLILSDREIEGRIVRFEGDIHRGYEITIEAKKSG